MAALYRFPRGVMVMPARAPILSTVVAHVATRALDASDPRSPLSWSSSCAGSTPVLLPTRYSMVAALHAAVCAKVDKRSLDGHNWAEIARDPELETNGWTAWRNLIDGRKQSHRLPPGCLLQ